MLLHEKPFAGLNGSGKHNNWSLSTDDGQNLLDPGKTPHENAQFLVFLCAVIKGVDEYANLLRLSAASPGNDHRLGASEAPPAIISIFLGDQLTDILQQMENGGATSCKKGGKLKIGVSTIPNLPKDTTDRNRTSPFAFTGNKFEFRMVPSSASIAGPNFILNTIVAEMLCQIADRLENAQDINSEVQLILKEIVTKHKRIIFNGNNYSEEWIKEAEKRGLPNIKSTVEAVKTLVDEKNVELFEKHNILTRHELESRCEIILDHYIKTINIEALTTMDIANRQIIPAVINYTTSVANSINSIIKTGLDVDTMAQKEILKEVSSLLGLLKKNVSILEKTLEEASKLSADTYNLALFYKDNIFVKMSKVREVADKLETLVDEKIWPFPTYGELLFNI